jgi:hypothetical protein
MFSELKSLKSANTKNSVFSIPIYNNNNYNSFIKNRLEGNHEDQLTNVVTKRSKEASHEQLQSQSGNETTNVNFNGEVGNQETTSLNWDDLEFSSLVEFGFTKRHVDQIKNFNKHLDFDDRLNVNSVQESIEHYAWALHNRLEDMSSYAPINNRLRGLIGVLRRGGNWIETNYESPEDLAFKFSMASKQERLEKVKAQKEAIFNVEFSLWRESLSSIELSKIEERGSFRGKIPPNIFKNRDDNKLYLAILKTYFRQNIYTG